MVTQAMSMESAPGRVLRSWLPAVLTASFALSGCAQVIGLDKDYREEASEGGVQDAGCPKSDAGLANPGTCPTVAPGVTELRELPGGYCIDRTEVTWGQYEAWLAKPPAASAEAFCSWNTGYAPKDAKPLEPDIDTRPVTGVDWCDAFEYCKQNGKRLCGSITSGGAVAFDSCSYQDHTEDQWYNACSSGGTKTYTWGNDVKDKSCNGGNNQTISTLPVGSMSGCMSSELQYNDVFDLTGNVIEWEDSCDGANGANDRCRARGGSYQSDDVKSRCDYDYALERSSRFAYLGFRCCS